MYVLANKAVKRATFVGFGLKAQGFVTFFR